VSPGNASRKHPSAHITADGHAKPTVEVEQFPTLQAIAFSAAALVLKKILTSEQVLWWGKGSYSVGLFYVDVSANISDIWYRCISFTNCFNLKRSSGVIRR
jgi:hypothetical protein